MSSEAMQQGLCFFGLFNVTASDCDAVSGQGVRMALLALGTPAVAYHPGRTAAEGFSLASPRAHCIGLE